MNRRSILAAGTALLTTGLTDPLLATPAALKTPMRTRWKVRTSEGLDAIAFLGPLFGGDLYREYYQEEADAFSSRLPIAIRNDITAVWREAGADGFGLLGPNLQVLFSSGGNDATIETLIAALQSKEDRILPCYRASRYWSASDWAWFTKAAPRLDAIFSAMSAAQFSSFRAERTSGLIARAAEVERALANYDVTAWQSKLTGRAFDPVIEVVLLQFSKPHGIKVQGQVFLQSADYDAATTVRIAAHEMLHPPFDEDGPAARSALHVLRGDPIIARIVREHDSKWGYTTLEGMLNEDMVQALDQLISEALGVARNPADRWRKSDDGMHVIAAGLYGLLREDRWVDRGGSLEGWLLTAARTGRLRGPLFHRVAARVLGRPEGALWPLTA